MKRNANGKNPNILKLFIHFVFFFFIMICKQLYMLYANTKISNFYEQLRWMFKECRQKLMCIHQFQTKDSVHKIFNFNINININILLENLNKKHYQSYVVDDVFNTKMKLTKNFFCIPKHNKRLITRS